MKNKKPFTLEMKRTAKTVRLTMSGYIERWNNNSASAVAEKLTAVGSDDTLEVMLRNLYGGSVQEGLLIYHDLKALKPTMLLDGVAASMGAIIFQAGEKRIASKHSRLMLHRVSGMADGDPEQIAETAKQMLSYEQELVDILVDRTGLDAKAIRAKYMVTGKDVWLDADAALKAKLCDKVQAGSLRQPVPDEELQQDNPDPVDILEAFEAAMREPEPEPEQKPEPKNTTMKFSLKGALAALVGRKASEITAKDASAATKELQGQGLNMVMVPVTKHYKNSEELLKHLEGAAARAERMKNNWELRKAKYAKLEAKLEAAQQELDKLKNKTLAPTKGADVKAKADKATPKNEAPKADPLAIVHDENDPLNKLADSMGFGPKAKAEPKTEEAEA